MFIAEFEKMSSTHSRSNTPSNTAISIASSMGSQALARQPFSTLSEFIAQNKREQAMFAAPRTIIIYSSEMLPSSLLAEQKYTPRAATYVYMKPAAALMCSAAIPSGVTAKSTAAWASEAFRLQYASIAATMPAAFMRRTTKFWRSLSLSMSTMRLGAAWFLGSFPNATCPVTASLIHSAGSSLVQNPTGRPLSGEEYTFATYRVSCERANKAESEGVATLHKETPTITALVATMYTRQISVYAFATEMRGVRTRLRGMMSPWAYRALGLDVDMIWEVSVSHVLHGYSLEYLHDVLNLEYFHLAVGAHTSVLPEEFSKLSSEIAEIVGKLQTMGIQRAPAPLDPVPEEEQLLMDDSKSEVASVAASDRVDSADLPSLAAGLGYDYSKQLANTPNSVMGAGDEAEVGF